MYKKLYIIIILLSLSIFTEAYGRHGMEMRRKHTEFDKRLGHDPLHFFRKIGITLTGEQEEKIYDIAINFIAQEEPIRLEIENIDRNIKIELMKENTNRNLLKELIRQKKEQEALRDYLRIIRDLDIIDILTSEQKAILNKKMRDRF